MKHLLYVLIAGAVFLTACSKTSTTGPGGGSLGDTWCLWIGADMDTYVSCGRSAGCDEGDLNFGQHASLVVALWELAAKRTYIHFLIPNVPQGTEVLEAYLNLYHGGKNEDGHSDDVSTPFQEATEAWTPMELTWNNQPSFSPGGRHYIDLKSQAWSGSDNISDMVRGYFDDPSSHKGIVVYWSNVAIPIEKGFYSNNYTGRKADDLGLSPRLLVKIKLPSGKTINDVTLPPLSADTDLDFAGQQVLMMRYSPGSDWPEDWDAQIGP